MKHEKSLPKKASAPEKPKPQPRVDLLHTKVPVHHLPCIYQG